MIRGLALRMMKGWAAPELEPVFARARELCHQLDDPPELFPVLWALTLFHAIRGDLRVYRERADELMAQAEESGQSRLPDGGASPGRRVARVPRQHRRVEPDPRSRAASCTCRRSTLTYTAMYGLDPGMIARAMSSRPLWILGYPDRADQRARETLTLARSQRQPMTLVFALVVTQGIHLYRGEAEDALEHGRRDGRALPRVRAPAGDRVEPRVPGRRARGARHDDEGIDQLKDSLAVQQAIGSGLVRTAFLALLGEMLAGAGRMDEGLRAVDEGFAHAETTLEGGYLAELHRVRGELLRRSGNHAAAEESLRLAIARAIEQQAKSFELRAATDSRQAPPFKRAARRRARRARAHLRVVH